MFESMKNLASFGLVGKTGENSRRIAAALVLQKAANALTEVFGEESVGSMTPVAFRDGKLTIETRHGVWSQDLALRRQDAIDAINLGLGQTIIKSIIIR